MFIHEVMMAKRRVKRFDAVQLAGKLEKTEQGFLKGDAVVTRTGVFPYRLPGGEIVMELRHPDDVFSAQSLDSIKMLPVTYLHPVTDSNPSGMVTAENRKEFSIGNLGETITPDGPNVHSTLSIQDADAIDKISTGESQECSMGYTADLIEEQGEYNGQRYDMRQRSIRYNHLAIVGRARVGAEARLNLDSADAIQQPAESVTREERKMRKVKLDNGLEYEAVPEVVTELDSYRERTNKAEARLGKLSDVQLDGDVTGKAEPAVAKHLGTVQGKLDAAEAELKKLREEGPKATLDAAKARLKLLAISSSVLDEAEVKKLDEMSDLQIKKAVVIAATPEKGREAVTTLLDAKEKLGEAGEAYITARFDAASEGINLRDERAIQEQRATVRQAIEVTDGDEMLDADEARRGMIASMGSNGKKKEGK